MQINYYYYRSLKEFSSLFICSASLWFYMIHSSIFATKRNKVIKNISSNYRGNEYQTE